MAKESKKLEQAAKALGYTVYKKSKSGHTMWKHPNGSLVLIAGTPSDSHSNKNALNELRSGAKASNRKPR